MQFLDPLVLARLSGLHLKAKTVVEGLLSGLHSSPNHGHSLEFAQHRDYTYGDELRHIDWKVYGRSDKFFVKQFQDETNLRAYILLDSSLSMAYKYGKSISKFEYASYLASALAYLLLKQEDAVSMGIFNSALSTFIPPHNNISHLSLITDMLEKTACEGRTDIPGIINKFIPNLKKRGLVIIISDLLSDPEEVLKNIKFLKHGHHEVIVMQVLDKAEIEFPFEGENKFVNLESGASEPADAELIRNAYKDIFAGFLQTYKTGFRGAKINYQLVTTDMPVETALWLCLSS